MPNTVVELYSPERLAKLKKRCDFLKRLLWILALAALAVCVILTARADTRSFYRMLLSCIGVSVGTAWVIIYLGICVIRNGKHELEHAANIAEGEREAFTGRVTVEKFKVRIRNSITLRKVRVDTEEGPVRLNIHIDKADRLKKAGERLTLYAVHGYVVAYSPAEGGERHEIL